MNFKNDKVMSPERKEGLRTQENKSPNTTKAGS
jgi:hypothetical protein